MSEQRSASPISVDDLIESVRQLRRQDEEGFRRLVDEISREASLGEAIKLAKALEYPEWELAEAVDSAGLTYTLTFLRKQAAAKSISPRVM